MKLASCRYCTSETLAQECSLTIFSMAIFKEFPQIHMTYEPRVSFMRSLALYSSEPPSSLRIDSRFLLLHISFLHYMRDKAMNIG